MNMVNNQYRVEYVNNGEYPYGPEPVDNGEYPYGSEYVDNGKHQYGLEYINKGKRPVKRSVGLGNAYADWEEKFAQVPDGRGKGTTGDEQKKEVSAKHGTKRSMSAAQEAPPQKLPKYDFDALFKDLDGPVNWTTAFEMARFMNEMVSQEYGKVLADVTETINSVIKRMQALRKAKALLTKLQGVFPADAPGDKKLSDYDGKYNQKDVDNLNKLLAQGGLDMDEVSGSTTKSALDSLEIQLTGDIETLSGTQGTESSRMNLLMGKIQTCQTADQGMIAAQIKVEQNYARAIGNT